MENNHKYYQIESFYHQINTYDVNLHDQILLFINDLIPGLFHIPTELTVKYLNVLYEVSSYIQENFNDIVVIGMGGAILNSQIFNRSDSIYYIYSLCPKKLEEIVKKLDLYKTAFIVISNSGNTSETIAITEYFIQVLKLHTINIQKKFIIFTRSDTNSVLKQLSIDTDGWLLPYDYNMGGRFAIFTLPSILIMLLNNLNIDTILSGARHVMNCFINCDNQFIQTLQLYNENEICIVNGSYYSDFYPLIQWYNTALSESLGKKSINIFLYHLDLPVDQHGLLQSLASNNITTIFNILTTTSNSSIIKLAEDNLLSYLQDYRCNKIIIFPNGEGALIIKFILEMIIQAYIKNLNPFIQPHIDSIKQSLYKSMTIKK